MQSWFPSWPRIVTVVLALAVLASGTRGAGGSQPGAKDKDSPQPLAKEVVVAWEKAVAVAGWMRVGQFGHLDFISRKVGKPGDLPAFLFVSWKAAVLPNLPAPEVPFGLFLTETETQITDAGLKELTGLKQLQSLNLRATKITDSGLKELAELKPLQSLDLFGNKITDAGLKELAELKPLQSRYLLFSTQITNAGLKELAGLKQLQTLYLSGTKITDAGLKELAGLNKLQSLNYVGQPGRKTARPSAELLLRAMQTISVSVVEINGQTHALLSPLTAMQQRLLELWGLPPDLYLYENVTRGFPKPPTNTRQ